MSSSSTPPPAGAGGAVGRPGRYQRSTNGLVGAVIILVVIVLAFVGFRAIFRSTPTYETPRVDYLSTVALLQQGGTSVVYPATLPQGWFAKDVHLQPGDRPELDLALATADGAYAGVHEGYGSLTSMLETYVDADPAEGAPLQVTGTVADDVAGTWQSWSDSGGDHAYSAQVGSGVGSRTVLVYGSASAAELRDLLGRLSTQPLPAS